MPEKILLLLDKVILDDTFSSTYLLQNGLLTFEIFFTPKSHILFQSKSKHARSCGVRHPLTITTCRKRQCPNGWCRQRICPTWYIRSDHAFASQGQNSFMLTLQTWEFYSKISGYTDSYRPPKLANQETPLLPLRHFPGSLLAPRHSLF